MATKHINDVTLGNLKYIFSALFNKNDAWHLSDCTQVQEDDSSTVLIRIFTAAAREVLGEGAEEIIEQQLRGGNSSIPDKIILQILHNIEKLPDRRAHKGDYYSIAANDVNENFRLGAVSRFAKCLSTNEAFSESMRAKLSDISNQADRRLQRREHDRITRAAAARSRSWAYD